MFISVDSFHTLILSNQEPEIHTYYRPFELVLRLLLLGEWVISKVLPQIRKTGGTAPNCFFKGVAINPK